MGNVLNCLNGDKNILERKNEIYKDDFLNFNNNEDNNYNDEEDLDKYNNNDKINDLNNPEQMKIYNMKDLTRNQILRLRELIQILNDNGKARPSNDFNPNNYSKFYPKEDPYFYINNSSIIHNKLIIYNQNQNNINNIMLYQGDLNKNDQRHGIGKLITSYYVLIGMWKNDKFSGWGRESRCNGDVFEGRFENGLINGKGIFLDSKKNRYIGDFKNMKRWGKGKWITNKIIYEGEFYNNKIHGKGKIKFLKSGIQYIGTFQNDQIDGYGIFKWINGDKYEGEVKNGKMHGKGKYQYNNGKVLEGNFTNGQITERKIDNKSFRQIDKKMHETFDYKKPYRKIDMDSYTFDESRNYIQSYNIPLGQNREGKKMSIYKCIPKSSVDNSYNRRIYRTLYNNQSYDYKKGLKDNKNNILISNTFTNPNFNYNYKDITNYQNFEPIQENTEYIIDDYNYEKIGFNELNSNQNNNKYYFKNLPSFKKTEINKDNKQYINGNYKEKNIESLYEEGLIKDNILYDNDFNNNLNIGSNLENIYQDNLYSQNNDYNINNQQIEDITKYKSNYGQKRKQIENNYQNQIKNNKYLTNNEKNEFNLNIDNFDNIYDIYNIPEFNDNKNFTKDNNIEFTKNEKEEEINDLTQKNPNILLSTYRNHGFGDN